MEWDLSKKILFNNELNEIDYYLMNYADQGDCKMYGLDAGLPLRFQVAG